MMTEEEERHPLLKRVTSSSSESTSVSVYTACDHRSLVHRCIVLALICTIGIGGRFCQDSPSALQGHFLKDLHISETKYMCFYSYMQWTGIFSCLFGGYLIDIHFGNRLCIVLFSVLAAGFHAVFAIGALLNSYWLMSVARGIYGIVNGPLSIASDNITVKWFKTTSINIVFGLRTSLGLVGSVVAMNMLGKLYDFFTQYSDGHISLGITLFSGTLIAFVSFLASVVMAFLDYRADKMKQDNISNHTKNEGVIRLSDVKDFPATYWLIALTTTVYYMALSPFVGLGQVFFEKKYELDQSIADNANSMVYLMAAITMPIFGFLIDKLGRNLIWMFVGILLSTASHIILAFTFTEPYVATVTLGLGNSIFTATMWPIVSYVLALNHLGTAYGIMNSVIGIGQAAGAYFTGYLAENSGYLILEVYFTAFMAVSFILGSLLYITDQSKDGVLNLGSKERTKLLELQNKYCVTDTRNKCFHIE